MTSLYLVFLVSSKHETKQNDGGLKYTVEKKQDIKANPVKKSKADYGVHSSSHLLINNPSR